MKVHQRKTKDKQEITKIGKDMKNKKMKTIKKMKKIISMTYSVRHSLEMTYSEEIEETKEKDMKKII